MAHRPVLHDPDDRLRILSQEVALDAVTSKSMRDLIRDLKETMRIEGGIGIAAPQINVHERIIIVDLPERGPSAFFNPTITARSFKLIESMEGCLSVPECWGMVERNRSVTVTALNERAEEETLKIIDLSAIVFQHEIDHLDGILFIDRAKKIRKG